MKKLILYIVLVTYGVLFFPYQAFSLTADQVRQQMTDTNNQIEAINKEIETLSNQITQTSQEKNTLANTVKELTLTRTKLLKEKEQIQEQITETGMVINTLSGGIGEKEKSIDISKKSLSEMINELNQNDKILTIERLLSVDNFTDFSREYNNIISLNEKIRENIIEITSKKQELISSKTQKEDEQQNLNTLKDNLVQKEQVVLITQKEKDSLLAATKNKEATYQKMLADQVKKKDTFEKSLEDYEAQLKFILNPKLLPEQGSSPLSWPLSYVYITSPYGSRWGSFHYGVDLRASIGTSVKAMASGEVLGTGDTDVACKGASFGKWVFIKYNNGLSSTYGHLSVINAKVGQQVKAGDVVALSGNTGYSLAPHLHVAVYASNGVKVDTVPSKSCNGKIFTQPISALSAYLDPTLYLPKITNK